MASFLNLLLEHPPERFRLVNQRTGLAVASQLEVAFDGPTRRRGLLGRDAMPPGTALIIAPCSSVHTFSMRFPIDVVFAKRDGTVVKVSHAVPPWRLAVGLGALAAIELPAGTAASAGLVKGDHLVLDIRLEIQRL